MKRTQAHNKKIAKALKGKVKSKEHKKKIGISAKDLPMTLTLT